MHDDLGMAVCMYGTLTPLHRDIVVCGGPLRVDVYLSENVPGTAAYFGPPRYDVRDRGIIVLHDPIPEDTDVEGYVGKIFLKCINSLLQKNR